MQHMLRQLPSGGTPACRGALWRLSCAPASTRRLRNTIIAAGDSIRELSGASVSPLVLRYETPAGPLFVGNDGDFQIERPGNGGLRIWNYGNDQAAIKECRQLSSGMTKKHAVYNTGFSGAKLVLNANDIRQLPRKEMMDAVSNALHDLNGTVYTGCDLNSMMNDMEYLREHCPYVLASIGARTCSNAATAHGVFGSIQGVLDGEGGLRGKSFLVKGTGNVGRTVAELLVSHGAGKVYTYDIVPRNADIPGCENVSSQDWRKFKCDVLVPCSVSTFIDVEVAGMLDTSFIVGASNVPFETDSARKEVERRGIQFVPECVSSAGAVLADSIEHFDRAAFLGARPSAVYAYVRALTRGKTNELVQQAESDRVPLQYALPAVTADPSAAPVGRNFTDWIRANTDQYDVTIIGGGMAGAATAYYLAKDAPHLKTAVVEAASVAHEKGSSFGESRMYRQMYSDEYFSRLQTEALRLWKELETDTHTSMMQQNGLLFYGETDTGETVEGSIPGAKQTMDDLGIRYTYYDSAEKMSAKWPMTPPADYEGVYEATAGSVNSSLACTKMMEAAVATGCTLRENEMVRDIAVTRPGEVEVITSSNRFIKSKKVVLCAGPWTNDILSKLNADLDLEVHNIHWGHWAVDPELLKDYPQWFCFKKEAAGDTPYPDGGLYFGFPAQSDKPVIKVGIDFTPKTGKFITKSMAEFNTEPDAGLTKMIDDFLRSNWAGIGPNIDMNASPYTMTKDQYFVLDKLPEHEEVVVFTGGSGRAFKFAPLLGRCLADLTLDRKPSFNIEPFSASREAVRKNKPASEPFEEALAA